MENEDLKELFTEAFVQLPFDEINIRQLMLPTNKNIAYKAYIKNLDASPCSYLSFNEEMFENKAILDDPKYIKDVKDTEKLFIKYIYLDGDYDLISQVIRTLELKYHLNNQNSYEDYMIVGWYPYEVTFPEDNSLRTEYINNLFGEIRHFRYLYLLPKSFSDEQISSFFILNVDPMDDPECRYEFDIFRFDECRRLYPSLNEKEYYYELKQECGKVAHRKPELVYLYFENQFQQFNHHFLDASTKVIDLFYETDFAIKEINAFRNGNNRCVEFNFEGLFLDKLSHLYPFSLNYDEEERWLSHVEMFYSDFISCIEYIFTSRIDISELIQLANEYKKTNEFEVLFKFVNLLFELGRSKLYCETGKYNGKTMYLVTNTPLRVSFKEYLDDIFSPTVEINVFDTASDAEPLFSGYCASSSDFYKVACSLVSNNINDSFHFKKEDVEENPIYLTDLSKRSVINYFNNKIVLKDLS